MEQDERSGFEIERDKLNKKRKEDSVRRKRVFLLAMHDGGTVRQACKSAGVKRESVRTWIKTDDEFSKEYDVARLSFAELLEDMAYERVKNPDKGKGSDVLLMFLLNGNMPEKYKPQVAAGGESAKELISMFRKAANGTQPTEGGEGQSELSPKVKKNLLEILDKKEQDKKE